MPRARPRKPRLSRMDAAVDAMVPFGFPVEKVKKCVKKLLRVYGGDTGWPFIEEYAYKELIEAMLRDEKGNDEEEVAEDGNESKEKLLENENAARTSTRLLEPQQYEGPENNSPPNIAGSSGAISEPKCSEFVSTSSRINNGDEKGWDEKGEDPKIHVPSKSPVRSSPPLNSRTPHRRQPCYGWIESDEEDIDDFVFLKPALREKAALPQEVSKIPSDGTKPRVKRRSRWDLRPDDP